MVKRSSMAKNCPHRALFGCNVARDCVGCYYNPSRHMAFKQNRPGDPKRPSDVWFYSNKKFAAEMLGMLEDIKRGRGLLPGGVRCKIHKPRTVVDE